MSVKQGSQKHGTSVPTYEIKNPLIVMLGTGAGAGIEGTNEATQTPRAVNNKEKFECVVENPNGFAVIEGGDSGGYLIRSLKHAMVRAKSSLHPFKLNDIVESLRSQVNQLIGTKSDPDLDPSKYNLIFAENEFFNHHSIAGGENKQYQTHRRSESPVLVSKEQFDDAQETIRKLQNELNASRARENHLIEKQEALLMANGKLIEEKETMKQDLQQVMQFYETSRTQHDKMMQQEVDFNEWMRSEMQQSFHSQLELAATKEKENEDKHHQVVESLEKTKIELIKSTSSEMQSLRDIIKHLRGQNPQTKPQRVHR